MINFLSGKKKNTEEPVRKLSDLEEDLLRVEVYAEVEKSLREKGRDYHKPEYWIEFIRDADNLMRKRKDELQKQPEKEALVKSLRIVIAYAESCTWNENETIVDYPNVSAWRMHLERAIHPIRTREGSYKPKEKINK